MRGWKTVQFGTLLQITPGDGRTLVALCKSRASAASWSAQCGADPFPGDFRCASGRCQANNRALQTTAGTDSRTTSMAERGLTRRLRRSRQASARSFCGRTLHFAKRRCQATALRDALGGARVKMFDADLGAEPQLLVVMRRDNRNAAAVRTRRAGPAATY
jgi:hypothetical protein